MIAALALAAALGAPQAAPPAPRTPCLQVSDGASTAYTPVDDHTLVIHSFRRYWKLTTTPSSLLGRPDTFLINDIHGPATLCSALDFQLTIAEQGGGVREGLIAQDFVAIPPAEGRRLLQARRR